MEDQRRLKNSRFKAQQKKFQEQAITDKSTSPTKSRPNLDRQTSYVLEDTVFNDETSELSSWCKVICFQRTKQLAEFDITEPKILIDGTNDTFTTNRIGFNSFPTRENDKQMARVKSCIGKGVQLSQAEDGSLIALRLCKNSVFIKGHYAEEKLLETAGELEKMKEMKVFDFQRFLESVSYECNPARIEIDTKDRCLATCVLHICFIKNSDSDENCPCWVEIVLTKAVNYVWDAISVALQRRREVQENFHLQQPPALRMDSKMESVSAKALKLIRPSRYIETVKFKRKAWARKRVQSNPFLYRNSSSSELEGPVKMSRSQSASSSITVHRSPSTTCSSPPEKERLVESPEASTKEEISPSHGTAKEGNGELEYWNGVFSPEISSPNTYSTQVRAITHLPEHEGMEQLSPQQSHPVEQRDSRGFSIHADPLSPTSSDVSEVTYLSPEMDDSDAGESAFNLHLNDSMDGMIGHQEASAERLDHGRGSAAMPAPTSVPSEPSYSPQKNVMSNTTPVEFHYDENRFHHTEQQRVVFSSSGTSAERLDRGRSSIAMSSPTSVPSERSGPSYSPHNTTPVEFHHTHQAFQHASGSFVYQYDDQQRTERSSIGRPSAVSSQNLDGLTQSFQHQMSFPRV